MPLKISIMAVSLAGREQKHLKYIHPKLINALGKFALNSMF